MFPNNHKKAKLQSFLSQFVIRARVAIFPNNFTIVLFVCAIYQNQQWMQKMCWCFLQTARNCWKFSNSEETIKLRVFAIYCFTSKNLVQPGSLNQNFILLNLGDTSITRPGGEAQEAKESPTPSWAVFLITELEAGLHCDRVTSSTAVEVIQC